MRKKKNKGKKISIFSSFFKNNIFSNCLVVKRKYVYVQSTFIIHVEVWILNHHFFKHEIRN